MEEDYFYKYEHKSSITLYFRDYFTSGNERFDGKCIYYTIIQDVHIFS